MPIVHADDIDRAERACYSLRDHPGRAGFRLLCRLLSTFNQRRFPPGFNGARANLDGHGIPIDSAQRQAILAASMLLLAGYWTPVQAAGKPANKQERLSSIVFADRATT